MWQKLKPHLDLLISRFVFPCLCLTDEELEQFDDDPIEYCRAHFGGILWTSFPFAKLHHVLKPYFLQTSLKIGSHRL